jgi:hypothetical protein
LEEITAHEGKDGLDVPSAGQRLGPVMNALPLIFGITVSSHQPRRGFRDDLAQQPARAPRGNAGGVDLR